VRVDQNLGVDPGRLCGMACEHDEIVDPLRAFGPDAQFARGRARPIGASLLIVVTLGIVNRIVEPETDEYLGRMLRERDDVLDLLEALGQVLLRVVVAVRLRSAKANT